MTTTATPTDQCRAYIEHALYGPARLMESWGYDAAPEGTPIDEVCRLFGLDDDFWAAATDEQVRAWAWEIAARQAR